MSVIGERIDGPWLARIAERASLRVQRAILSRRVGRLVLEEIDGISLVVFPDVFNPAVFRTTPLLMESVADCVRPGMRVLDVGTGTGAAGIRAAIGGGVVVGVDVNPEAVRCARVNALLNHVEDVMDVREGDLFAPVPGALFDLVVCNPPFFRGAAGGLRDNAWRSDDFLERFSAGLDSILAPRGEARVVFSSHGDQRRLLDAITAAGLACSEDRRRVLGSETITVFRFARQQDRV